MYRGVESVQEAILARTDRRQSGHLLSPAQLYRQSGHLLCSCLLPSCLPGLSGRQRVASLGADTDRAGRARAALRVALC